MVEKQSIFSRHRSETQRIDVIEFFISDRKTPPDLNICGLKNLFPKKGPSRIQNKYEQDLMSALQKIDSIVKEVMNIQAMSYGSVEEKEIGDAPAVASAPDGGDKTVGLDEVLIEIKARLCGESSNLDIVPIVGMGGIGKTTLARSISQEYHLHEILLCLQNSLPVTSKDLGRTNEELMEYAYKSLKGRRYLIIMDDMWSTEAWDDLRRIFPDDNNGSRIVITTRLTDVAEHASSSLVHRMHFLKEDQSWNLLREKLFFEKQSCPPELEKIGKSIARSCGGLPLAIAVVAGILTNGYKPIPLEKYCEKYKLGHGNN